MKLTAKVNYSIQSNTILALENRQHTALVS